MHNIYLSVSSSKEYCSNNVPMKAYRIVLLLETYSIHMQNYTKPTGFSPRN